MLTIFSIPKPFYGHIALIQRNAIRSWTLLRPACEIILFGNDDGVKEVAAEFQVRHIPDVACNEYHTPYLHAIFDKVRQIASHPLICYVNADILLLEDLIRAAQRIRFRKFLMLGQRWDIDLKESWDFAQPDWAQRLRQHVFDDGSLHIPAGSDYFVFPRDQKPGQMPPFVVGRPGWDNWFIYNARRQRTPVVDVTRRVMVIHQNHDYSHVPNWRGDSWEGPETDRQLELISPDEQIFTLLDATHIMTSNLILPALGYKYLQRRWQTLPILSPDLKPLVRSMDRLKQQLWTIKKRLSKLPSFIL